MHTEWLRRPLSLPPAAASAALRRLDNAAATALFQHAVARDPGFARAHAGLSFVHFQTAFLRHSEDLAGETALARRYAERGLELDSLDPLVNFTMGRGFLLE